VHHAPVLLGLDYDVLELIDLVKACGDIERVLESLAVRCRRHAKLSGGDLLILSLQRADHVIGRERQRIEPVGIEPHPHRVLSRAENVDLADAGQTRELGLQVYGRVIGEEQAVVAGVRRCQCHELQDRGGFLLNRDALCLHRLRQLRERAGHPVLHQYLREVDVHSDLEGDDERIAAVRRAPRLHVDHAVDAVDLLLDRQSDGIDHGARARARIARGDGNRRRHHIGILRDREPQQRYAADHNHQHGEHVREDRTLDEEFRDHGVSLIGSA